MYPSTGIQYLVSIYSLFPTKRVPTFQRYDNTYKWYDTDTRKKNTNQSPTQLETALGCRIERIAYNNSSNLNMGNFCSKGDSAAKSDASTGPQDLKTNTSMEMERSPSGANTVWNITQRQQDDCEEVFSVFEEDDGTY